MRYHTLLTAVLWTQTAFAVPTGYVVHESRDATPARWTRGTRVRSEAILPVRIGLAQGNIEKAEEYLMALSRPDSPTYGRHWTAQEVVDAFKPSGETISVVRQWLQDAGVEEPTLSDNKAWFAFNAPASQVERLLHTEYYEYRDLHTRSTMPSTDKYHVPIHLQRHIDYITPGLNLLSTRPSKAAHAAKEKRASPRLREDRMELMTEEEQDIAACKLDSTHKDCLKHCDVFITPACIAALYDIPASTLTPNASNMMGIYESEFQHWDQTDLDAFFTKHTKGRIPNGTHPTNFAIDGGRSEALDKYPSARNGEEVLLDLDLSYPIVYPQQIGIWDENDEHYQHWFRNDTYTWGFNQFLDAVDGSYCTFTAYGETGDLPGIDPPYPDNSTHGGYKHPLQCGVFKPPTILSVSYGGQENIVPIAYQKRQCLEYLKLGLQGTTIVFASGDAGVGNYPDDFNGPTGCIGPEGNVFNPAWPNSCPWITNVGATKLYRGHSVFEKPQPEAVVFDPSSKNPGYNYSSGGGFSNIYPIPAYQKDAVQHYLTEHTPSYPYYEALSPNEPNPIKVDVAALQGSTGGLYNRIGRGYPDVSANGDRIVVVSAGKQYASGGTSASTPIFASIINRINEERMAIGKGPVGFINPVLYANPGMLNDITNGSNVGCRTPGFYAAEGWDPASGLGTPNYPRMLDVFLKLP